MPITGEKKRQLARRHWEENQKILRRYYDLVERGTVPEEARDTVKEAFAITDRRLDNVLDTAAGHFTPGTRAQLETKAFRYLERVDLDVQALRRHADDQLAKLEVAEENGEEWFEVKLIDQQGEKAFTKIEKLPIAEARKRLLEARLEYNQALFKALESLRVPQNITINMGGSDANRSREDLERERKQLLKQLGLEEVNVD